MSTEKREKLTLAWRGKSAPVAEVALVEVTEAALAAPAPVAAQRRAPLAPPPARSVKQEHYENVKRLLDDWADWMQTSEPIAHGAPRQVAGAPDARIQSFEDIEIEVNKRLVSEVNTAVWELPVIEREAVMTHYGLNTRSVWRANFAAAFELAIESLFKILRGRVAC